MDFLLLNFSKTTEHDRYIDLLHTFNKVLIQKFFVKKGSNIVNLRVEDL